MRTIGDSIEDMLNVTMKRLDYIMYEIDVNEALKADVNSLMRSAILILSENVEDISLEKQIEWWKKLQMWAKSIYVALLKMPTEKPKTGQFHLCEGFMQIIIESKEAIRLLEL